MVAINAQDVIEFWFAEALEGVTLARLQKKRWYRSDSQLDDMIRQRFGFLHSSIVDGNYGDWQDSAEGMLAIVIVLDQFTRHIHRGTARAFEGDDAALVFAHQAIAKGWDLLLPPLHQLFLYHPFGHSEHLPDQQQSVVLRKGIEDQCASVWRDFFHAFTNSALEHRDLVERFGRFPHRNKLLGRISTPSEENFLAQGASSYGQR